MALLALPEKAAAAAAFLMAPLLRSSMPRAALPSARSSPASTTSVPTGAADRDGEFDLEHISHGLEFRTGCSDAH